MNKIEYLELKLKEIKKQLTGTYLNKISSSSKNDFIFSFSKNNNLFISLNNLNPFLALTKEKLNYNLTSPFISKLKSKFNNSKFIDISLLNNDSIIDLTLLNKEDNYDKNIYHIIIELFKGNSNLIVLKENTIILAYRYHSLDSSHPIIYESKYIFPNKINLTKEFDLNKETQKENEYILNLDKIYLHEKYEFLISKLKRKKKTLENKEKALIEDKNSALKHLKYKEYADYFLINLNEFKKGDAYFLYENIKIPLKENLDASKNLNYLYKVYKKAKTTLLTIDSFLLEVKNEINYIDNILVLKEIYNEEDYLSLIYDLSSKNIIQLNSKYIPKKKIINKNYPYFVNIENHKVAYGKIDYQNNYLTFNLARKKDIYIHIKDFSGPHIILFLNNNETYLSIKDSLLNKVLSFALYLNKKDEATFLVTTLNNVKKGTRLGETNLLNYESYFIRKDNNDSNYINLIKKEERLIK